MSQPFTLAELDSLRRSVAEGCELHNDAVLRLIDQARSSLSGIEAEPVAWRIESVASPGEAWEWIEGRHPDEYEGGDDFTIQPLYASPPTKGGGGRELVEAAKDVVATYDVSIGSIAFGPIDRLRAAIASMEQG